MQEVQEAWVSSLGQADPLEKEMATHSGTLTWKIPWTGSLVGYIRWGHKELNMTEHTYEHTHAHTHAHTHTHIYTCTTQYSSRRKKYIHDVYIIVGLFPTNHFTDIILFSLRICGWASFLNLK